MQDERIGSPVAAASVGSDGRLTWTIPEVARLLGISADSAYEAAHRGQLPVRVIGRRMLVPRMALLRLLEDTHLPEGP